MPEEKKKRNWYNILTAVIFVSFIFVFAIVSFILPDKDFSEDENRYLKTFPSVSSTPDASFSEKIKNGTLLDRLIDGSFTSDFTTYLSDQFPARESFTELKALAELSLGKKENSGVTLGRGGFLIRRNRNTDETDSNLTDNLNSISAFVKETADGGTDTLFAIAPRTADLYRPLLASTYPESEHDRVYSLFPEDALILEDTLSEHTDEYIYYTTDHHWTTLGAYYAYSAIAERLGETPVPIDRFTAKTVAEDFYGTSFSKSGMRFAEPDSMQYFIYGNENDFTTTIEDTGESFTGFYDRSYLEKKDKYSSFIGGNNGLVTVKKTTEPGRAAMVIVKDSFAHSVAPFLAQHYDLYIVDTRYYHLPVSDLIKEKEAEKVLVLCGADTLTEGKNFVSLGIK